MEKRIVPAAHTIRVPYYTKTTMVRVLTPCGFIATGQPGFTPYADCAAHYPLDYALEHFGANCIVSDTVAYAGDWVRFEVV